MKLWAQEESNPYFQVSPKSAHDSKLSFSRDLSPKPDVLSIKLWAQHEKHEELEIFKLSFVQILSTCRQFISPVNKSVNYNFRKIEGYYLLTPS